MDRLLTSEAASALRGEGLLVLLALAVAVIAAVCIVIGWKAHALVSEARAKREVALVSAPLGASRPLEEDAAVKLAEEAARRAIEEKAFEDQPTDVYDIRGRGDGPDTEVHATEEWLAKTRAETAVYTADERTMTFRLEETVDAASR